MERPYIMGRWTTATRRATEITPTGYSTKTSSDRSTDLCVPQDPCDELFCIFKDFYAAGTQYAVLTKSLEQQAQFNLKLEVELYV